MSGPVFNFPTIGDIIEGVIDFACERFARWIAPRRPAPMPIQRPMPRVRIIVILDGKEIVDARLDPSKRPANTSN